LRKYNHYKIFWGTIRRLKVSFYRRSKALQYLRFGNTTLRFEKLRKIFPIFVCVRWVSLSRPPSSIIYLTNLTCFQFMVFDDWYRLKLFSIFLIHMYGIVMNCTLIVRRLLGKVTVSKKQLKTLFGFGFRTFFDEVIFDILTPFWVNAASFWSTNKYCCSIFLFVLLEKCIYYFRFVPQLSKLLHYWMWSRAHDSTHDSIGRGPVFDPTPRTAFFSEAVISLLSDNRLKKM
jgi:hypothetical protein